jgi:hypothetical protein
MQVLPAQPESGGQGVVHGTASTAAALGAKG